MTIKDEILEELRKGAPLAEINRKFRSQSRKYEAIREYLEEAEKIVEEMQKVNADLLERKIELERSNRETTEISGEIQKSIQVKEKLIEGIARKTGDLMRVNTKIKKLQERGFTPEILSKIAAIENRSGPDLLSEIETVEKYRQIEREVSNLEQSKTVLEGTVQNLRVKKEKLEKRLRSERNQLDELRLKTGAFRKAVTIVCSLFRVGYCTDDIKQLSHGLNMLGIKDDPRLSIKRLMEGLLKYKNLVALQGEIRASEEELEKLKNAISNARSELKVEKQLTKAFKEVKNAGVEAITAVAEVAKMKITDTAGTSEKHIVASAGEFNTYIQRTMEEVRTGLAELSDLQEKKGRLKEILHPAQVLLGILKSPEYLRQLPPAVVFQVLDRLHLWCEMNLKDVTIKPSRDIWRKDPNLNFIQSYRLPVLIEFVTEGLREIITQQSRKE